MRRSSVLPALRLLLLAACAPFAAGCAATRIELDYDPTPAEMLVRGQGDAAEPLARVLASVLEARRAGPDREGEWQLHLRLQVENTGARTVRLLPAELLLVDGRLTPFGAAVLDELPTELERGATQRLSLAFPLPEGATPSQLDLGGLNLRCVLEVDGRRAVTGATFARLHRHVERSRVRVGVGYGYRSGRFWPGVGWWW